MWVLWLANLIAVKDYTFSIQVNFFVFIVKNYKFRFADVHRHFVGPEPVCQFVDFSIKVVDKIWQAVSGQQSGGVIGEKKGIQFCDSGKVIYVT